MVAVGNDAAFVSHHRFDRSDIVRGGDRVEPMPHGLFVHEVDQRLRHGRRFRHRFSDDSIGDALGVLVEHEDQAETGRRGPFEVQPVLHWLLEYLLVRSHHFAEILQLGQRDEAQALEGHAAQLEILDVSVNAVLGIFFERPFRDPVLQILGRTGVLIMLAAITSGGLALCDVHDIILALAAKPIAFVVADDVVRRRNALAHLADHAGVESKRFERLYFHSHHRAVLATLQPPHGPQD